MLAEAGFQKSNTFVRMYHIYQLPIKLISEKKIRIVLRKYYIIITYVVNNGFRPEEGKSLATQIGATAYLECSALNKIGISDVFKAASKAALNYKEKINNYINAMMTSF